MDSLTYKRTNVYETADETLMTEIFDFAEGYKQFLDEGKTERECCAYVEAAAKAAGYEAFDFWPQAQRQATRFITTTAEKICI